MINDYGKGGIGMIYDIIVIGGGPAGMTAAIKAKETAPSASVKLIDKNKKLGKKLYATGKWQM